MFELLVVTLLVLMGVKSVVGVLVVLVISLGDLS